MTHSRWLFVLLLCAAAPRSADARLWTDVSGQYTIEAQLIALDDERVILQRNADSELGSVPIEKLSAEDRDYLAKKNAGVQDNGEAAPPMWTLRNGLKVPGNAVDYARREVTIQRRRGKIYVNNRVFSNLPKIYQRIVPLVVAHFEQNQVADEDSLRAWLVHRKGAPQTYTVEGVVLELEGGDEYGLPFFLFSQEDLEVLKPGWESWAAAAGVYDEQQDAALEMQSLAAAYKSEAQTRRQIAELQLTMQAVEAGVTSLWEVTLYPGAGVGGPPQWVVVTGRDSRTAQQNALSQNPGYFLGPVRRVSRR